MNLIKKLLIILQCALMLIASGYSIDVHAQEGLSFRGVEDKVLKTLESINLLEGVEVYDGELKVETEIKVTNVETDDSDYQFNEGDQSIESPKDGATYVASYLALVEGQELKETKKFIVSVSESNEQTEVAEGSEQETLDTDEQTEVAEGSEQETLDTGEQKDENEKSEEDSEALGEKRPPMADPTAPTGLPDNVVYLDEKNILPYLSFEGNDTVKGFDYTRFQALNRDKIPYIVIPAKGEDGTTDITAIGDKAFYGIPLYKLSFLEPSNIKTIGTQAFYNTGISEFVLPKNVEVIKDQAFAANLITDIDLSEYVSLKKVGKEVFWTTLAHIDNVVLNEGLEEIGDRAFLSQEAGSWNYHFMSGKKIVFPSSLKKVGSVIIGVINSELDLSKLNPSAMINDNSLFWTDSTRGRASGTSSNTIIYSSDELDTVSTTVYIFDKVNGKIVGIKADADTGGYSDWNDGNLVIPKTIGGVDVVGLYPGVFAFNNAHTKIKSVSFDPDLNITELPYGFFPVATKVVLPEGLVKIPASALYGYNYNLQGDGDLVIPTTVEGDISFIDNGLTKLTVSGHKVTSVTTESTTIKDIYLEEYEKDEINVITRSGYAEFTIHWKNGEVTEILPEVVVSDDGLWRFNPGISRIYRYLGDPNVTNDYWDANTKTIKVPSKLTYNGQSYDIVMTNEAGNYSIFSPLMSSAIEEIIVEEGIKQVGGLFSNATKISLPKTTTQILPNGITSSSNFNIDTLNLYSLPNLQSIGSYAFNGCTSSRGSLKLPGNLTVIAIDAFAGCSGLTDIRLDLKLKSSDGVYDPANKKYLKASSSIVGNKPFGSGVEYNVFFIDDIQPFITVDQEILVDSNQVKLNISGFTNDSSYFVKQFSSDDLMPNVSGEIISNSDGTIPSVAEMLISNKTANNIQGGNGVYSGVATWGLNGDTTLDKTIGFKSTVTSFHQVLYDANGGTGTTIDVNAPYVEDYAKAEAVDNAFRKPDKKTFKEWNTKADGSGTSYAPGSLLAPIKTDDLTLYAIWGDDVNGDDILDEKQVIVNYVSADETQGKVTGNTTEAFTAPVLPTGGYADTIDVQTKGATATPEDGYSLKLWTEDLNNTTSADGKFTLRSVPVGTTITITASWSQFVDENDDLIPDQYQVFVDYVSADESKGTVTGAQEVFTAPRNADGTYTNTVNVITEGATAAPKTGYALDVFTEDYSGKTNTDGKFSLKSVPVGTKIKVVASWAEDSNGDGVADKYQVIVEYVSTDTNKGTVTGTQEVFTAPKNADGTYANTVNVITEGATAAPKTGYALDLWTESYSNKTSADGKFSLKSVPVGTKIQVAASWAEDSNGDSVADKYQVLVKYVSADESKGKVTGEVEAFTPARKADGTYASTVNVITNGATATPESGYALDLWTENYSNKTSADGKYSLKSVPTGTVITVTASWAEDSNDDDVPDHYQVLVKYVSADETKGKVTGEVEAFTPARKADGKYEETVSFMNTAASVSYTTEDGYALDKWTESLTGLKSDNPVFEFINVEVGQTITISASFDVDENGDGISDKYQLNVTYNVVNGTWDDDSTSLTYKVNKYNKDFELDENGFAILGDTIPSFDRTKPLPYHMQHGIWQPSEPLPYTVIVKDTTYELHLTEYSYNYTKGAYFNYVRGSNKSVNLSVKRSVFDNLTFDKFVAVYIDDNLVDPTYYTATPGSVDINLKSSYLEKLRDGTHSFKVEFDDGSATTKFTVETKTPVNPSPVNPSPVQIRTCQDDGYPAGYYWDGNACVVGKTSPNRVYSPNTGDTFNVGPYLALGFMSLVAAYYAIRQLRKSSS